MLRGQRGFDTADDKLVQEAFSEKALKVGKPRLRVPGDPANPTRRSRRRGALQLQLGVFAIRNPAAHEDEWPEPAAAMQLAALSMLDLLIDSSAVCRCSSARPEPVGTDDGQGADVPGDAPAEIGAAVAPETGREPGAGDVVDG